MSTGSPPPARPTAETLEQLGFVPRAATRWLAPRRFLRTTSQTMLAEVLGAFTDRREALAALDGRAEIVEDLDLSGRRELWIDQVCDTGDGFAATYAVAWAIAHDELTVAGHPAALPAGELLVFGGDEVYPVASDAEYRDRLVGPYRAALPWRDGSRCRHLIAIPGNHDWYDGLGAWTRRFCQHRWLGAWESVQRRSYAAVRMPHHWWLWAVDIALAGQVDKPQVEYFTALAERAARLAAADATTARLVIVTSKPTWIDARPGRAEEFRIDPALDYLEAKVAGERGIRVAAVLSGDDHYYARYEADGDGPQRVTCGGGGAFLHPTDHIPRALSVGSRAWAGHERDETMRLAAVDPSAKQSRRLRWRALWFGFHNGAFPVATALAYLVWALPDWWRALGSLAAFAALAALTRRPALWERALWALPHLAAHVGVMALAAWIGGAIGLLVAGALVGPVVIGLYFVVAGTIAGVNDNEAFSAIGFRGHKAFLRLHLDGAGHLVLHAVGIRDVPKRSGWRLDADAEPDAPWFAPVDGRGPTIRLIDGPVELR